MAITIVNDDKKILIKVMIMTLMIKIKTTKKTTIDYDIIIDLFYI